MSLFYSPDRKGQQAHTPEVTAIPDYHSRNQQSQPSQIPRWQGGRQQVQHYVPRPAQQESTTNSSFESLPALPNPRTQRAPPAEHYDPRRGAQPRRPPRPNQSYDHHTPTPQERHHQIYQQFFQESTESHHGNGQWNGTGYTNPAAQSTADLNGLYVPPNNLQALINQMRNRAPLGPPPSARRGPSSYYSDTPAVHPIVEETASLQGSVKHGSTRSFDSHDGRVIPAPSSFYPSERSSAAYSEVPALPEPALFARKKDGIHQSGGNEAPTDNSDVSPPNGHVRQASIGMKTRPTLTTVKSSDRMKESLTPSVSDSDLPMRREFPLSGVGEREKEVTPAQSSVDLRETPSTQAMPGVFSIYSRSPGPSTDALASASSVSSLESSDKDLEKKPYLAVTPQQSRLKSPLVPLEFRDEKSPVVVEKEVGLDRSESGALPRGERGFFKPSSRKLSDRVGNKKPAHLNLAAVREAEGRGSLTSLPDLINRATKLASNLDRGKTASRLGMTAWLSGSAGAADKQQETDQSSAANYRRSAGSLSDMLASFPPPAIGTPPGSRQGSTHNQHYSKSVYSHYEDSKLQQLKHGKRGSLGTWSMNLRRSVILPSDSDLGRHNEKQGSKKRRCCGLPLWLFLVLLTLAVCLAAVAIIVPVVVVVIPQQQQNAAATGSSANSTTACAQTLSCQNGGTNIIANDGKCRCVCVNGYSGSTCTDAQQADCSASTISGTNNATVGTSIPRIINDAKTNFSIPLDGSKLIGLFSGASLSCASENSLITFNNLSKRDPAPDLVVRMPQAGTSTTTAAPAATTSDGLVFQAGTPTIAATSTTAAASAAPSSTTPVTGGFSANSTTLDFARTAVLYIFQSSGQYTQAVSAQQALQNFFSSSSGISGNASSASSVALGNGATVDLLGYKIQLGLGAAVGGGGAAGS